MSEVDILEDHSAARRVLRIMSSANVANLLFTMMSEAFRKVRISQHGIVGQVLLTEILQDM